MGALVADVIGWQTQQKVDNMLASPKDNRNS